MSASTPSKFLGQSLGTRGPRRGNGMSLLGSRLITNYLLLLGIVIVGPTVSTLSAQTPTPSTRQTALRRVNDGAAPRSVQELKALEQRIQALSQDLDRYVVAVRVGQANGSGVIIDGKGHVLTAAHVAGHPGRYATLYLSNGKTLRGITRGLNQELDAGLIQIVDPSELPHAPLGDSSKVRVGQYCVAVGHPGGYESGGAPELRFGRVLRSEESAILTDCTLQGGDSGGPLFNLDGEVIGIHSRIGKPLSVNVHVPVNSFVAVWDRLEKGELWGRLSGQDDGTTDEHPGAWLGVVEDTRSERATIRRVSEDSPAERAGVQAGDTILRIGEETVENFRQLQTIVANSRPGQRVRMLVERDDQLFKLDVQLGRRPASK